MGRDFDSIILDAHTLEQLLHAMELPAQRLVSFAQTLNASEYDLAFSDWLRDGRHFCEHFILQAKLRRGRSATHRREYR